MNFLEKIEKLASIYYAEAQVMELGTSTISPNEAKSLALKYKDKIEQAIKDGLVVPKSGWSKPGKKLLDCLDSIISGKILENADPEWAKLDIRTNLSTLLNSDEQEQILKLLNVMQTLVQG